MKKQKNLVFLGMCLFLGVVADLCLFEEKVGISYSIIIGLFYLCYFYHLRKNAFTNRQISLLVFICIWALTITYFLFSNPYFYTVNFFLIPLLVFFHTVLLTSPSYIHWYSKPFISLVLKKISQSYKCLRLTLTSTRRKFKQRIDESTYHLVKKVGIGIALSLPLLIVVIFLLSSADSQFASLVTSIPKSLLNLQSDYIWSFMKICFLSIGFYCYLKVAGKRTVVIDVKSKEKKSNWDQVIVTTILIFLNVVYLLFTIVQFQYFFSGTLAEGVSYAEYARRGFFELILVTLINYGILLGTVTFVKNDKNRFIKLLLTLMISFSGIMLVSAFLRLTMYEQAYGFTYLRILAHSFMVYLAVVFAFTLVKVWAEQLVLIRFYLIITLLFYVGVNLIGIDQIIVNENIERYKQTGKIDINYLEGLSYSTTDDLVELYQIDPNIPGLKHLLLQKNNELLQQKDAWQSLNLSEQEAKTALATIDLKK